MLSRRTFLRNSATAGLYLTAAASFPFHALGAKDDIKLTILHTNDVHSRIEPFPSGRYKGLGGAARRSTLIQQIRKQEANVLLLDAGDIFQGTPYFNFFEGEVEFKLMNEMGYDAATIGNHDFDAGMDALKKQAQLANFPLVNLNYDFSNTILDNQVLPYTIVQKGPIKIGVMGVGVALDGLVPEKLFGKTRYQNPIAIANKTAYQLKKKEKCHFVICLSHLGYKYKSDKVSDEVLAQKSSHIDLILGGHTHTFLEEPTVYKNANGETVLVNQVGWAGIVLGRLDIYFRKDFRRKRVKSEGIKIG